MVEQYAFTLVCSRITDPNNLGPESRHQALLRASEDLMAHALKISYDSKLDDLTFVRITCTYVLAHNWITTDDAARTASQL